MPPPISLVYPPHVSAPSAPSLPQMLLERGIDVKDLETALDEWLNCAYELQRDLDPADAFAYLAHSDHLDKVQRFVLLLA